MLTEQKAFRIDKLSIIFFDETNQHSVSVLIDMKENSKLGSGKIEVHGNGMGVPSPEIVEARERDRDDRRARSERIHGCRLEPRAS